MARTPRSTVFTALADKIKTGLAPYKKAIAIMKELQDWGPDAQGRTFEFEVVQNPWLSGEPTLILGSYANVMDRLNNESKISAIVFGLPSKDFKYEVRDGWYKNNGNALAKIQDFSTHGYSSSNYHTAKALHEAVIDFAKTRMNEHPRFKAAMKATVEQAISKIKPVSPV